MISSSELTVPVLQSLGLFRVIELAALVLIPLLGSVIGYLMRRIRNLERTVDDLEQTKMERSYTLFGVDQDPNSKGIAEEVVELRREMSKLHHDVRYIRRSLEETDSVDLNADDHLRTVTDGDEETE
jgi:cell division protein FtsB